MELVKGGQGRSDESQQFAAEGCGYCILSVVVLGFLLWLTGCDRPPSTEERALVQTCAVASKLYAASFDAIRTRLAVFDKDDKEAAALAILKHSNGLNAQALLLNDVLLTMQAGGVLDATTKQQLITEADAAVDRADRWRELAPKLIHTEDTFAWFIAHQEALDHQAVLLKSAVTRLEK